MPIVTIQQSPRELESKRRLVAGITQAFVVHYGVPPEGGRLAGDRTG
jgi:phenylpyruvate tautomerase PptA (4-oxalocrotonate tautomerase family)